MPRHIERVSEVIKQIESAGLSCVRKTALDKGSKIGADKYETVILCDTIGELLTIYSVADCVFVGRSLVPQGGTKYDGTSGTGQTSHRWTSYL